MLTFTRKGGNEELVVAINMSNRPFIGTVESRGNFDEVTPQIGNPLPPDDEKTRPKETTQTRLPALSLDAFGFRIFKRRP